MATGHGFDHAVPLAARCALDLYMQPIFSRIDSTISSALSHWHSAKCTASSMHYRPACRQGAFKHTTARTPCQSASWPTNVPPSEAPLNSETRSVVIMWGEIVDTSDIASLWSPRSLNDFTDARDRMQAFRCPLNRRAVAAAPVDNTVARSAPPGPGSCYHQ